MMKNRDLVSKIAAARKIAISRTNQETCDAVIRWFQTNEPEALSAKKAKAKTKKPNPYRERRDFYKSWEWRTLRMEALKRHGPTCQCCGARAGQETAAGEPVRICVDHIKPVSKYWALRLDPENLQILCDECNQGKGAWDQTDWRDEGSILDDEPMSLIEQQLGERLH